MVQHERQASDRDTLPAGSRHPKLSRARLALIRAPSIQQVPGADLSIQNTDAWQVSMLARMGIRDCAADTVGVDHERRPELVGRLAHLPKQRREHARGGEQRRAGDTGPGWHRPPCGLRDHIEELLRGQRPGRGQMPDLPVGFLVIGQDQQPAGDVGQEMEGMRLVEPPGPPRLLPGQDPAEHLSPATEPVPCGP